MDSASRDDGHQEKKCRHTSACGHEPTTPLAGARAARRSSRCRSRSSRKTGRRQQSSEQGDLPKIHWAESEGLWVVGFKDEAKRSQEEKFPVCDFLTESRSNKEADLAALRGAVAFRSTLMAKRDLPLLQRRGSGGGWSSCTPGVNWRSREQCWEARLTHSRRSIEAKRFECASGAPPDIERARRSAEEQYCLWKRELEASKARSAVGRIKDLPCHDTLEQAASDLVDEPYPSEHAAAATGG